MDIFKGKGTIGIGDAMFYMNVAHRYVSDNDKVVELQLHWEHDEDFYYHFEDPETIVERVDYLHQFYYNHENVIITHVFNSTPKDVWEYRLLLNGECCIHHKDSHGFKIPINHVFDPKFKLPNVDNKVVVWRSKFNAEQPRKFKRFTNDKAIDYLQKYNYQVIEIDYRTPVREAMYHINTCDFIVCYEGMWHHIGALFCKPMLVLTNDNITKKWTPQAQMVSNGKEYNYLNFITDLKNGNYNKLLNKAKKYELEILNKIGYNDENR